MARDEEKIEMYGNMMVALELLEACPEFAPLVPEVRTNMVYARRDARTPMDVMAVGGRVTVIDGMPRAAGRPAFGASSHMARLMIELMATDPALRAGIDFRADTLHLVDFLEAYAASRGWTFSVIDRSMEPEELHDEETASMPWKVAEAPSGTARRTASIRSSSSRIAVRTPLSGATNAPASVRTATAARSVPTPGSTTTRWTVSRANHSTAVSSTYAAAWTS